MHEGCFLQTRLSRVLKVTVDQKTRPRICFKTSGRTFLTLIRALETPDQAFEGLREK